MSNLRLLIAAGIRGRNGSGSGGNNSRMFEFVTIGAVMIDTPDRALAYLSARVHISEPGRLSLSDLIGRLAGRSIPNVTLQRLAERATG